MRIFAALDRAASLFPQSRAVAGGPLELTYMQLADRVGSIARFFKRIGLAEGDRISILDINSAEYIECYFAASRAGLVINPLNYRLAATELAFILRDAGSRVLIASPVFAGLVEQVLDSGTDLEGVIWLNSDAHDPPAMVVSSYRYQDALLESGTTDPGRSRGDETLAHLYYTSGTTGNPKGVMLTDRNVMTHALGAIAELRLGERDVWAHIAPMFHLADAWATFAITLAGGTHWMVPRFEPRAALEAIQQGSVTITNLIPTMLNLMINHPDAGAFDYSSLRMILSGGAPISAELVDRIVERFGCEYVQTYGMTETSPYLTLSAEGSSARASCRQADGLSREDRKSVHHGRAEGRCGEWRVGS